MKLAKLGAGPEIFQTIQGEGISAGCPAVFIRTSRCNLHCQWCDTDHTWNFEGTPWSHENDSLAGYAKHNKSDVTVEVLPVDAAKAILAFDCPRVVITGGEPMLQENELLETARLILNKRPDCIFEVETNGTRIPSPEFGNIVHQFNVSPKLSNARMPGTLRIVPEALTHFAKSPKAWFKFVVASPSDLAEIQTLRTRFAIPPQRILLMPEGRTAVELNRSAPQLAALCSDLGYRFCDRLHIRLWGDKRGV